MRPLKTLLVAALVIALPVVLTAQDPVKTDPKVYKVLIDNASVRVLEVRVPVGGKTAMHSHPDSIIVPLTASKVRFTHPDGKAIDQELPNESATYAPGGAHQGTNTGTTAVRAIVVEFKGAGGKAALPTSRPGMTIKPLAEGPRAMAYRSTTDAKFAEPAGTTHDYDQVVIALAPSQIALTISGKPTKSTWARGDVQFIGRGVAHESKNTSGKSADVIIVAIK